MKNLDSPPQGVMLDGQRRIDTERLAGPPPPVADLEDPRGIVGPEAPYLGTYTANSSTGL